MKIAFTGTSGSGKTTMVKFVEKEFNLKHISGSAGDVLHQTDKDCLEYNFGIKPGNGHYEVIRQSAIDSKYGWENQLMIQQRRAKIIRENDNFVTDRSPLDNLTYFISQVGFHLTDSEIENFAGKCLRAWFNLTHVIYIRAVQPNEVENNGSRIANKWYQKASDAQFNYWLFNFFMKTQMADNTKRLLPPKVLIIDFWDLEKRKSVIREFLREDAQLKLI